MNKTAIDLAWERRGSIYRDQRSEYVERAHQASRDVDQLTLAVSGGGIALVGFVLNSVIPWSVACGRGWIVAAVASFGLALVATLLARKLSMQSYESARCHLDGAARKHLSDTAYNKAITDISRDKCGCVGSYLHWAALAAVLVGFGLLVIALLKNMDAPPAAPTQPSAAAGPAQAPPVGPNP